MKIFTHIHTIGEIKTGFTLLQSKHSQFREYFILNNKERFDKEVVIFSLFLFHFLHTVHFLSRKVSLRN